MFNKLNKKVKKTLAVSMSLATILASVPTVSFNNNTFATSLSGVTSKAVLEWRNHPDNDGSLCLIIDTDGNIAINQWLIHPNGNDMCYVEYSGKMVKGWAFFNDGEYYYFDTEGKMVVNQWLIHPNGDDLCYVGNNGKMVKDGWGFFDDGEYYYFDIDGKMVTRQWLPHPSNDGSLCYVGNDGKMIVNKWVSYNTANKSWDFGDQNRPNKCTWVVDAKGKWSYLGTAGFPVERAYRKLPNGQKGYLGIDGALYKIK